MIFIANALPVNGGTTFLLRLTREFKARGRRCAVLLLRDDMDASLADELRNSADIIKLSAFLYDSARIFRAHLGIFGPVDWQRLRDSIAPYGDHVHVMSVFGLSFALRLNARLPSLRISAGVYHQNEFLYRYPPFAFAANALRQFKALPTENLIFFNESVQSNYARFYGQDRYKEALLVPIGIELPEMPIPQSTEPSFQVVSIGNLLNFKTYNRHMIHVVASLRDEFPGIRYHIYGTGPEEGSLRRLVRTLEMGAHVRFHGVLPYDRFQAALEGVDCFVGSGTALVEAAALGVPALVGIESIETPDTYGFLCDIHGFSYNENMPDVPTRHIIDYVRRIFSDQGYRQSISAACSAKAQEFSVTRTADGFEQLLAQAEPVPAPVAGLGTFRLMLSLIAIGVAEKIKAVRSFSDRRNQSF